MASGLKDLGVGAGDPVAIVLPNCPQHIVAFYAVLRLGAVVVEHNPLYTPRELRKQFEDHGAKTAIVWSKVVETVQQFPDDLAVTALVSVDVTQGDAAEDARDAAPADRQGARGAGRPARRPCAARSSWERLVGSAPLPASHPLPGTDDLAIIQYTSGTTGTPKGASLTHRNLLSNAAQARAWVPSISRGPGCVVYAVLPMFHAYGLTLCLTFAMSMGARLVLFPRFDPDMVLARHEEAAGDVPAAGAADRRPPAEGRAAERASRCGAPRSPSPARWPCRTSSWCRSRPPRAATSSRATGSRNAPPC